MDKTIKSKCFKPKGVSGPCGTFTVSCENEKYSLNLDVNLPKLLRSTKKKPEIPDKWFALGMWDIWAMKGYNNEAICESLEQRPSIFNDLINKYGWDKDPEKVLDAIDLYNRNTISSEGYGDMPDRDYVYLEGKNQLEYARYFGHEFTTYTIHFNSYLRCAMNRKLHGKLSNTSIKVSWEVVHNFINEISNDQGVLKVIFDNFDKIFTDDEGDVCFIEMDKFRMSYYIIEEINDDRPEFLNFKTYSDVKILW